MWAFQSAYRRQSDQNLKLLVAHWKSQQAETDFDVVKAKRELPPRLSAWSHRAEIRRLLRWRGDQSIRCLATLAWLFCCCLLIVLVYRKDYPHLLNWARWLVVVWVIASVGIIVSTKLPRFPFPGDHKYIDDYVYVPGLRWKAMTHQDSVVVAYERAATEQIPRAVAMMDGSTRFLAEEELAERLRAQGQDLFTD